MDCGSWPDWVSAVSAVAVAGAAICAAWQGVKSLSAWREETVGRRRMELAEDVIADFYEARDNLSDVRSPGGEDVPNRPGRDREPDDIRRHRDIYYVPIKRLTDHAEFFARMRARRYRVIATFGADAAQPFADLQQHISRIRVSAHMLMITNPNQQMDERAIVRDRRWREAIWEGWGEPDQIKESVDRIVASVEERFRKEIAPGD